MRLAHAQGIELRFVQFAHRGVDLVDHQHHRALGAAKHIRHLIVRSGQAVAPVHEEQDHVRRFDGNFRLAAHLAQQGADMDTITARASELCGKMRQLFVVDDLKFLRKGGRLSGAAALAGTLLQIKPILEGDPEGKIVVHSKERGRKKAMEQLIRLYQELVEDKSRPVGISHAAAPAEALHLATELRQAGCTGEILSVCHEPVTGAHVGPGMLALYFYSASWR